VQLRVAQSEPVGVAVDSLGGRGAEERQDRLEGLVHHPPLLDRVDAHHVGVRRQRAGPVPNMTLPRVRWSSSTQRSATISGWW